MKIRVALSETSVEYAIAAGEVDESTPADAVIVEIPSEQWERYERALAEWIGVQDELAHLFDAAGGIPRAPALPPAPEPGMRVEGG